MKQKRPLFDQWILRQVLKFKPRLVEQYVKRIADVDLIPWDVYLLSMTSVLLISNGSSLFLLTDVYLVTIAFSDFHNMTGCEWHPSDQAMQCPVFIRTNNDQQNIYIPH